MINRIVAKNFHRFYLKSIRHYDHYVNSSKTGIREVEKRQLEKLNRLINHAIDLVPFYKEFYSNNELIRNGKVELRSIGELSKLPMLTKKHIQENGALFMSKDAPSRKPYKNTSGGSTGSPITVYQDQHYGQTAAGLFLFIKSLRGIDPFGYTAYLWGAHRDLYGSKNSIQGKLKDFANNIKKFNAARLDLEEVDTFIQHINTKKPELIVAYAQSIYELAKIVKEKNIKVVPQKAIHTGAGKLYEYMREEIEDAFQCKVFDHYGGREFGAVATECTSHDGLHILTDEKVVEIVDENGEHILEEEGDVLVTTLNNYSMPLIRYNVGDRAIMQEYSKCSCGVTYPKLRNIVGRTANNFKLKSGGFVSGEYLTLTFNFIPGVVKFQIRQKSLDQIDILLVVDEAYDAPSVESEKRKKLESLFGKDINVEFKYMEEIPLTSTGKHLFTISEVK